MTLNDNFDKKYHLGKMYYGKSGEYGPARFTRKSINDGPVHVPHVHPIQRDHFLSVITAF